MKIRQGFVSNSSSSSFIIAFPKKPKSFDDVYDMMFDGKDGGISIYDRDGMSYPQISMEVWKDIKSGLEQKEKDEWQSKCIPASKKEIAEEISNRYFYYSHVGGLRSIKNGWCEDIGPYFGSDIDNLTKLRDFIVKTSKEESYIRERQKNIICSEFKIPKAKWAYEGGKDMNGKPYTKKDIKAHKAYTEALDKFKKEHKEYQELEEKIRSIWNKKYKTEEVLRNKIAKADAKAFMQDNKGAFFAILHYSDDSTLGCTMEHGNIFRNVPHIKVSNH